MKKGRGMARLARRGQTGYSQPIPKAGIGGSPRFAVPALQSPLCNAHTDRHFRESLVSPQALQWAEMADDRVIDWLLAGDAAIRWQTLRDLAGGSGPTRKRGQRKVASEGWGARLLPHHHPGIGSAAGMARRCATWRVPRNAPGNVSSGKSPAKAGARASFHTTILALEALLEWPGGAQARARAEEFLLLHRLFRSHRTGKVAKDEFTRLHFPPRWHYDV